MVFVKFHNMNRKKNFLMSPLNSNKLKKFHFTSQNNITITVQKCSVFFSSFFSIYVLSILLKLSVLSFFFFLFHMLCSTMLKFLFFLFSFFFHLHCPVAFFFLLVFFCFHFFLSFFFSFHNKLLIQCLFFFNLISTSLCPYLNTITIGSLPSLFNFNL